MKERLKLFNNKGFTLIELIVVIAILGILAAIAVPRIAGFQNTAKAQANKQTAIQVRNAISLAIANGDIVMADPNAHYVKIVPSATNTVEVETADADDFNKPSDADVTTPLEAIIGNYVTTFSLKQNNSVDQAVGRDITETQVRVAVGEDAEGVTVDSYDYSNAD